MAITRQTMTDEQRKSVALEYLKAFDNGGVTSTGGAILDLFATDAQVMFPSGASRPATPRSASCSARSAGPEGDPPPLQRVQLDHDGHRPVRLRGHEPRRAPRRPVAGRRSGLGRRALV